VSSITLALFTLTSAWTPFLQPLGLKRPDNALVLILPLVFAIALTYKTLKLESLDRLLVETCRLSVYIMALIALAAGVLYVVVEWV